MVVQMGNRNYNINRMSFQILMQPIKFTSRDMTLNPWLKAAPGIFM